MQMGPGGSMSLGSWITEKLMQIYHQYGMGSRPVLYITKRVHSTGRVPWLLDKANVPTHN
jgi:hypothetical protein